MTLETVANLFNIWLVIAVLSKGKLKPGTPFLLAVTIGLLCSGVDRSLEAAEAKRIAEAVDAEKQQHDANRVTFPVGHDDGPRVPVEALEEARRELQRLPVTWD